GETPDRVVADVLVNCGTDGHCRRGRQQRVAVGGCRRGGLEASGAASAARAIVDDDWLPERQGKLLPGNARHDVRRAARRESHDHLDRPCWVGLRKAWDDKGNANTKRRCSGQETSSVHGPAPSSGWRSSSLIASDR